MSLEKTQRDTFRSYTELKKYPVNENLPAFFETEYPKLVRFLENYYEEAGEETVEKYLEGLQYKRDFVQADQDLLRFFSQELLLGRDYFDLFIDKQSAIQTSNLLYRSKGTHYSIQQFFRVFFGFDVDVRYGRDEVFISGDPNIETDVYQSRQNKQGLYYPTDRIKFHFDDGDIQVFAQLKNPIVTNIYSEYVNSFEGLSEYVENQDDYIEPFYPFYEYGVYKQLEQDRDYTIDFRDNSIQFVKSDRSIYNDPWTNYLAENGEMHPDSKTKIVVKRNRPAGSFIGSESSDKRITNNGFYQLFALAIKSPIAIKRWRQSYKDFVHPSGMYLEGDTEVTSAVRNILSGKRTPDVSMEQYRKVVKDSVQLTNFVYTMITELNIDIHKTMLKTWSQQGYTFNDRPPYQEYEDSNEFYVEEQLDSDRPDRVYRTRINDIKNIEETMEVLDQEYINMAAIDTIAPRTMDENTKMSQTVNTVDENMWHKDIIGDVSWGICPPTWVLGDQLDFPPEYAGCPGFVFGVGHQRIKAQFIAPKLMNEYYAGIDSPAYWTDSDGSKYIGAQSRTTPGPAQGLAEWKITAKRGIWPSLDMIYSIDYTIEIPSVSPSSVWSGFGDFDYSNSWKRSKVEATVTVTK